MTATYTFDVFSSLDGFGSASRGDWGGGSELDDLDLKMLDVLAPPRHRPELIVLNLEDQPDNAALDRAWEGRADLRHVGGRDLEFGWLPRAVPQSRNGVGRHPGNLPRTAP